jgi:DNA polymerase III sliding clamp (beta) subunit (PCNA family)
MKIEVAKADLYNALSVAGITVGSGNDLSGHYLFRIKDEAVEVLTFDLRVFSRAPVTPATFEGEEGDAFTVESWRLDRWMAGVSANKPLVLEKMEDGEVSVSGERSKIRLRSLDPSKFPFWDGLLEAAEEVGTVSPQSLAQALSCSRWFVSADDTSKPELCQIEAVEGILWATDRRALSSVEMPRLPDLSMRLPGKDVPSVIRFLSEKTTQENPIEIKQAERSDDAGGGACALFVRPDGSYVGVTRPSSSFPTLNVDRDAEDQVRLTLSREEFNAAIDVLLAGAPKDHESVTFIYDNDAKTVHLSMPCEAGDVDDYPLSTAKVSNGDEWNADFTIDYAYLKGIADTFNLSEIDLGITERGRGGFVSFRHTDGEEGDTEANNYYSVIVWRT